MIEWIHESNLIEDVDDPVADQASEAAWVWFLTQDLTTASIIEMHKRIMECLNPYIVGDFRQYGVCVGGFVAPPASSVPTLMTEWIEHHAQAKTEKTIKHAHIAFEKIHPFEDGNGRSGRMLMNWQREKAGLKPLLIKASTKWDEYYSWFKNEI